MGKSIPSRIDEFTREMKAAKTRKKPQIEPKVIVNSEEGAPWKTERWHTAMIRLSRVNRLRNIRPRNSR